MAIGRYRGSGGAYIQRYRAGQRGNIPRHIGRQRMPMVRNTTIFLDGYSGGHHHCYCRSYFARVLAGVVGFFFGSRQTPAEDPNAAFRRGYQDGEKVDTPTGNDSATPLQEAATKLDGLLEAYGNNHQWKNDKKPTAAMDSEGNIIYCYDGKNYSDLASLKAAIEKDQETPVASAVAVSGKDDGETGVKEGRGGKSDTAVSNTNTKKESAPATDYTNSYNNTTGFKYLNSKVTITDKNVPEIVTLSAFILNDNDLSTISLKEKDWIKDFKLVFGENQEISEIDFTNWFENYAKEAEKAKSPRVATETVNISDSDKAFIKQLYKAMSDNGNTLSAAQFKTFMEGFFKDTNGSFSRKEFAEYVQKKLDAQKPSDSED